MRREFIGRHKELQLLDRLWESNQAELLVLYGRRRVGKTRLLTHWMQANEGHGLYWMAEPTSPADQLRSFSQALYNYSHPDEAPPEFTYATWEQAFSQVSTLASNRRMALFIDEITYLIDINPNIVGTLQKVWDHRLKQSNLFLALSGSRMSVMQEELLAHKSPLYGRATTHVNLHPLPFGVTYEYFPDYTAEERIAIYGIWGGIPAYWERINNTLTIEDNLRIQLGPSNAWMMDEPRLLLQDFLNDPYYYAGIMRAMAHGAHTLSEIGKMNALSSTHMTSYLKVLRETGFVERIVPVTQRMVKSRLGRYHVTDPYMRFYYRFLAAYQSKLALGKQEQVISHIQTNLSEFLQENTWKELCHEWVMLASAYDELPIHIEAVGGEWKRSFDIDVVGISEMEKNIVIGSCLWEDTLGNLTVLDDLIDLTSQVIPKTESWNIYYVGFSKLGWEDTTSEQAEAYVEDIFANQPRLKWTLAGIHLLDLTQVDHDLLQWSQTD